PRIPRARTRERTAARERASSRYLERATPCAVPLIPRRVALAARVGTAAEDAVRVDRDRLRAAGDLGPLAEVCDLVAPRREPLSRRLAEARFHLERTSRLVIPARLLDGSLHIEAVIDEAHRELEVRLHLRMAAGRPEDEAWRAAVERDHRVERVDRPLARPPCAGADELPARGGP